MRWHEAYEYVAACQGAQVNFDTWKRVHKEAKIFRGVYCTDEPGGNIKAGIEKDQGQVQNYDIRKEAIDDEKCKDSLPD